MSDSPRRHQGPPQRRPGQHRPGPRPHSDHIDHSAHRRGTVRTDAAPLVPADLERLPRAIVRTALLHPSIYRKRLDHVDSQAQPGDWVKVESAEGQGMGYGWFNPKSEIPVRVVFPANTTPSEEAWDKLIDRAVSLRQNILRLDDVTDSYRVIHAEGDFLPGLVVDRFGDTLSAEVFSLGAWRRVEAIMERIARRLGTSHTLIRTAPNVLPQEGFDAPPISSEGLRDAVTIQEYGTRFRVRFEGSHKTGFFCDQRDNRRRLADFCKDRTVLDLCCYTGGFSVQAKKLGCASEVTGVDLDESPLRNAQENANLNQVRIKFVQADVFPFMRDMLRAGRTFDVVVLDPPKLIRSRAEIDEGTRKHFDLNRLAMQLVAPGGVMLSCTCAGLLPAEEFSRLVVSASRQAGDPIGPSDGEFQRRGPRPMRILAKSGAAPDHPIASNCPESEYLQAIWMQFD